VSQPSLGQQLPVLAIENSVARLVDDGDFFTQEGDPVTHRCLLIQRVGGPTVFGNDPGKSTPADRILPTGAGTREQVAAFRVPLSPGDYRWYVWGGIHSTYAGAYDVYEWGGHDLSHPDRVATGRLHVGSEPTPQPPPAPTPATVTLEGAQAKARAALYELVQAWRAQGQTDQHIYSTMVYQLIRAMEAKGAQRKKLADAIRGVFNS
jgi:hypothetical protein